MTGRQLLLDALRNRPTPRPAWVPFVGVHGGKLIGASARDYLHDPELIVKGLTRAAELYRPDGLPVVFDLQLEAEVLGCELQWAEQTPPSVVTHPMSLMEGDGMSLDDLPPFTTDVGRFPRVFQALADLRERFGEEIALYGLVTGPFTLGLHLMGNDIFFLMYDQPEQVRQVLAFCADIAQQTSAAYLDQGADVVAVVDPMTSQISPDHFHKFVAEPLDAIFNTIHDHGGLGSMFVCGDATRNLEHMCRSQADNVSVDENIPLDQLRELAGRHDKSFGGNLKLTSVLLLGNEEDARRDTLRCLDAGGERGFILAPGCDLPYATPEANLQAVAELVHDSYQRLVALQALEAPAPEEARGIELPDYDREPAVTVDVVTLDSAACAPCQYMFAAAMEARRRVDVPIVVREHRINTREGLAMMQRLGVEKIPSICIDGQVAFASLTPDTATLVDAITRRAAEKAARP